MPSSSELQSRYAREQQRAANWLGDGLFSRLRSINARRGGALTILYASAWLQKPSAPSAIVPEDVHGFMDALSGVQSDRRRLTLILHTPGGDPYAAESIVEYLHAKFDHIEVVVPYLAMSAGSMISLAGDRLLLGRQSQLGPIDPQMLIDGSWYSARAIHDSFASAQEDIIRDVNLAHL